MTIEYLAKRYHTSLKEMVQSLRESIVGLEVWEDDLMVYDTSEEAEASIHAFEVSEVCIFVAIENEEPCGYVIGRIRKESSKGSKIERFGSVGQLYVKEELRGKGIGKKLLERIEKEFLLFGATHMAISVFAPNIQAHNFYKHLGFEERLITLAKPITQ